MKTIRQSVFETNSSSTHCVTIMTEEAFERFKNDEILYDFNGDREVTWEEFYDMFVDEVKKTKYSGEMPTFLEFKEAVAKEEYWSHGFEDDILENTLWRFVKYRGIYTYECRGEITTASKDGYVAVSMYEDE